MTRYSRKLYPKADVLVSIYTVIETIYIPYALAKYSLFSIMFTIHGAPLIHSQKCNILVASCLFFGLVATCKQVATNLSISSSCNKSVQIRLVLTCHLQTCYNFLIQLAASLWITRFDNQLATSLLTTCNRLFVNKLSQTMPTHPDIGLLITSLLQDVSRLVATSTFLAVYLRLTHVNHRYFQVQYLNDFAAKLKLKISYNTEVKSVSRPLANNSFLLQDQHGNLYTCNDLIVR